jgi:hypothetical protein
MACTSGLSISTANVASPCGPLLSPGTRHWLVSSGRRAASEAGHHGRCSDWRIPRCYASLHPSHRRCTSERGCAGCTILDEIIPNANEPSPSDWTVRPAGTSLESGDPRKSVISAPLDLLGSNCGWRQKIEATSDRDRRDTQSSGRAFACGRGKRLLYLRRGPAKLREADDAVRWN